MSAVRYGESGVRRGEGLSRVLYDTDLLGRRFEFGRPLVAAVRATFARRGTPVPEVLPVGPSDAFATDSTKQVQRRVFLRKSGVADSEGLGSVVARLRNWLCTVRFAAWEGGPEPQDSNAENPAESGGLEYIGTRCPTLPTR